MLTREQLYHAVNNAGQWSVLWTRGRSETRLLWAALELKYPKYILFSFAKFFLQNIEKFHNNQWLICITVEKVKLGTVLCINVAPRPHRLETRVVIKISTHPCLTAFNGIKQAKNAFFVFFASKKTFPLIIWIFTEGDGIESRLPFKIYKKCTQVILKWSLSKIRNNKRLHYANYQIPCRTEPGLNGTPRSILQTIVNNLQGNIKYTYKIQVYISIRHSYTLQLHADFLCMHVFTAKI